jgi:hypothetical protein
MSPGLRAPTCRIPSVAIRIYFTFIINFDCEGWQEPHIVCVTETVVRDVRVGRMVGIACGRQVVAFSRDKTSETLVMPLSQMMMAFCVHHSIW